jgi:hypothetical protein
MKRKATKQTAPKLTTQEEIARCNERLRTLYRAWENPAEQTVSRRHYATAIWGEHLSLAELKVEADQRDAAYRVPLAMAWAGMARLMEYDERIADAAQSLARKAADVQAATTYLSEAGRWYTFNSCGEIQGRGLEVDTLVAARQEASRMAVEMVRLALNLGCERCDLPQPLLPIN